MKGLLADVKEESNKYETFERIDGLLNVISEVPYSGKFSKGLIFENFKNPSKFLKIFFCDLLAINTECELHGYRTAKSKQTSF